MTNEIQNFSENLHEKYADMVTADKLTPTTHADKLRRQTKIS